MSGRGKAKAERFCCGASPVAYPTRSGPSGRRSSSARATARRPWPIRILARLPVVPAPVIPRIGGRQAPAWLVRVWDARAAAGGHRAAGPLPASFKPCPGRQQPPRLQLAPRDAVPEVVRLLLVDGPAEDQQVAPVELLEVAVVPVDGERRDGD